MVDATVQRISGLLVVWLAAAPFAAAQADALGGAREKYQQTQYKEALALLAQAPSSPAALQLAGQCHYFLRDYKRAAEVLEKAAQAAGFSRCVFCAVVRPADHPARPADYTPLDAFWAKRDYARIEGLVTGFSWRDVGEAEETVKPMEFWEKRL